ncbi:MAG: RNAase [Lewinellaceae bacterium]|nr:RNAase [Lewinellaceae bacterium]
MRDLLQHNVYFVKEHVGMFKSASNYDIYNEHKQLLMECREPNLGWFTKLLRFTDYKRMTPFEVIVTTPDGKPVLRVERGWTFLRSVVQVFDENDTLQGKFRQRLLSLGGKFDILDEYDVVRCTVTGKWTAWEYKFMEGEHVIAEITKKWAGIGKEFFTTADNYTVSIDRYVKPDNDVRLLILAAAVCIDKVFKE